VAARAFICAFWHLLSVGSASCPGDRPPGLPYFGGPGNNYSMHAIVEGVTHAAPCARHPDAAG